MAENRTKSSTYPSKFGVGRFVTAAQWLAELMCERRARQEGTGLPLQFWKTKPWDAVFRQQVAAAHRLLAQLDPGKTGLGAKALSIFLRSEAGKDVYSLSAAWILPHLKKAHVQALREGMAAVSAKANEAPPAGGGDTSPPLPPGPQEPCVLKKNLLSRLRELD